MALNELTLLIGSLKEKKDLIEALSSGDEIERVYLSLPKYNHSIDPEETRKALSEVFTKISQNPWTKKTVLEDILYNQTYFLKNKERLSIDVIARLDPLTEAQAEFVVNSGIDLYTIVPYIKYAKVFDNLLKKVDYAFSLSDLNKVREEILKDNLFKVTATTPDKEFFKNYQISYEDIRVYSYIFRYTSNLDYLNTQVDRIYDLKKRTNMTFFEFDLCKEVLLNENIDKSLYLKILKNEMELKEVSNLKILKNHKHFSKQEEHYFNFQLLT